MLAVYVHILDFFGLLSVVSQHDGLCSRRGYVELKGDGILPNLHGPYRRVLKIALLDSQIFIHAVLQIRIGVHPHHICFSFHVDDCPGFLKFDVRKTVIPITDDIGQRTIIQ